MERLRNQRTAVGFLIGFTLGCGVNYLLLLFFNRAGGWLGSTPVVITFWRLLPLGLLMGTSMALLMRNPPFGD